MLIINNTVLVIIDIQEKLFRFIHQRENLIDNVQKLLRGILVLNVPVILTEQYPQGLGSTLPEIKQLISEIEPMPKLSFSCCGDENFVRKLEATGRRQVLISGIETHVCVYQTVADLIKAGYEVHVVTDTVSSRTQENKKTGLNLMSSMGAALTSTETVLFELLKIASGENFKAISRIIR
jgi:nicotinamidase-related amidase